MGLLILDSNWGAPIVHIVSCLSLALQQQVMLLHGHGNSRFKKVWPHVFIIVQLGFVWVSDQLFCLYIVHIGI